MRKPIGFWDRFLARLGLKWRDKRPRCRYHKPRRPQLESLETRQMLTITVAPSLAASADRVAFGSAVTFTATMPADAGGNVTFKSDGTTISSDSLHTDNGSALQFDGSTAYVDFGNHPWQNLGDQASVSAWVRIDGSGARNGITLIKQNASGATGASYGLVYGVDTHKINY
ncbi:MAG TPA: hypothetical protein VGZ26_04955 [Pirellulales bacterium]|nr:hypothetical protein [Pirellulales bacterium]